MKLLKTLLPFVLIFHLANAEEKKSIPKNCPFGHTTLMWQKIDPGCILPWDRKLHCTTCDFAYIELISEWRSVVFSLEETARLPNFSSLIRNLPTPSKEQLAAPRINFYQTRNQSGILSEECVYWTNMEFDAVKKFLRDYFTKSSISPRETTEPFGDRIYSYFYARVDNRFLKIEVMLNGNKDVLVHAYLLAPSRLIHEYQLCETLGIEPPH